MKDIVTEFMDAYDRVPSSKIKPVNNQNLDISELICALLDNFSRPDIPVELDRHTKAFLINSGYCADFALECLLYIKVLTGEYFNKLDIKVYEWETIHTFFVIDGMMYDASLRDGRKFTLNNKVEYYVSHLITIGIHMNEYYTLVSKDNKPLIRLEEGGVVKVGDEILKDNNNEDFMDIYEYVYTVDEFIKKMQDNK